jgi:hypothetical protein
MSLKEPKYSRIYEIPELKTAEKEGIPELLQSKYTFNSHVFPNDLGMTDNSHYVVFNINVQAVNGSPAGRFSGSFDTSVAPFRSKVDQLRFVESPVYNPGGKTVTTSLTSDLRNLITNYTALGQLANIITNQAQQSATAVANILSILQVGSSGQVLVGVPRATRRIAESIALHMPTPLVFNTHNIYEEISLTALGAKLGVAAVGAAARLLPQSTRSALNTVTTAAGQAAGVAAQLAQRPINPMVEILFATTAPRQFTFEVLMAPRNEKESETIKSIIKAFRFHGAPEIGGLGGLLWIPPADFDITFFNKGVENVNILRINTCVLERIEVDYAPTSGIYSTFRNGHPVAVRMSLGFRELEPLHKERINQGF